ncbi:MAG TPA: acyl-[acyl-carrier-protein]--UDP-N-acetylglucosamine O-acyltransferase [Bacteroidales bacterium]|nr:acyl-[acyl-carrier-protein]--UDP-N-acetylglucosamine O-acyltransferase [Bacteroidales bacterium]
MISNQAFIHPDARIGKNVKIEPYSYISGDVVIGDNSWIGPNATVLDGARMGENCRVFPGAVISAIPQDMKFSGERTTTEIGNNCTFREGATINRGTVAQGKTIMGNNCLMMANSHVAHDCILGNNCILVNNVLLAGEVHMDDYAIMGGGSAAHQFCRLGAHVMVSGGAMFKKDIPPYILVNHNPVGFAGINKIGLKRRGFKQETIGEIEAIYKIIYFSDRNISQALEHIKDNFMPTEERDYIIDFISGSKRGILKSAIK